MLRLSAISMMFVKCMLTLCMLAGIVVSSDYVCCSVVFDTLVGVFMFSVMRSELPTSAISCPKKSSVYTCQRVECAFTSPVRT